MPTSPPQVLVADERPEAGFAEIPRQRVAAGAGHLVDDHHLRPVDGFRWARPVVALAGDDLAHDRALQVIDDVVGELAAFVEALVDDHGFFAHLRKEVAVEAGVAAASSIGHVHVGHAASRGLIDLAAIALDPGKVAQALFAFDGHHGHLARVLAIWICADLQHDLLAGGFLEKAVDIVGRMQFAVVYGKNVVTCFDVDSRAV